LLDVERPYSAKYWYFKAIRVKPLEFFFNLRWSFGIVCGLLVIFARFGMLHREKSGNPETSYERTHEVELNVIRALRFQSECNVSENYSNKKSENFYHHF
jgi:hypothetical protein